MKTFIDPNLLHRLRVGPLAPYLDAYLKHMEQEGFSPSSAPMQMYAIARFSKWLGDRPFDLREVDEATVKRFLKRDPGVVHSGESATLPRLLAMLRRIGVTLAKAPEPVTGVLSAHRPRPALQKWLESNRYSPFTNEQWVEAVFHVPESFTQVSLQMTVRARCVPLSSAS